jgi:histidinol-phosphate/aromatic aminotransferase/cobyric acid decarboxylase-like protein
VIEPRPELLRAPEARHGGPSGDPAADAPAAAALDFSASVSAYGPAPAVARAARRAPLDAYPDPTSRRVRERAAERWGRAPSEVVFGAGAAELIFAVALAYVRTGDAVLIATPTFGEYARAATLVGATVHEVRARQPRYAVHSEAVAAAVRRVRPRLAFLCAPNNPTGQALSNADVRLVADACDSVGALLVLDQSYDTFADRPLGTPALPGHPAVLHLRSITKDHALAGLRAAFAVGPAPVAAAVERARVPWAASSVAQAAAEATFGHGAELYVRRAVAKLRAERLRVEAALTRIGLPHPPTSTHFLLVDVGDAARTTRLLGARGVKVRDCSSFHLPRHIRVSVRKPTETGVLIAALRTIAPPGEG